MLGIEPVWLLVGLVALHIITLLVAYWRETTASDAGRPTAESASVAPAPPAVDGEPTADEHTETVRCSECGTRNVAEYAYCRGCVADLRGGGRRYGVPLGPLRSGSA